MTSFSSVLAAGPLVLDGGLGTLLEARGNDLGSDLWSARLLLEAPDEIRAAHADFARAGAQVAITASYQLGYEALQDRGFTRREVDDLLARSVALAREGASEVDTDAATWVAASVGPFGATRADGSEYTGSYGLTVAELRAWHRPRLHALAAAGADVLAIETIPSLAEVEAICAELAGLAVPAWLSVTCADGNLRSGEPLGEAAALAASVPEIVAVGVNCCTAADARHAVPVMHVAAALPAVVYPNSGEVWDAASRSWSGGRARVRENVESWLDAGAALIGGCCRVGPDEIAEIAAVVRRRGDRPL